MKTPQSKALDGAKNGMKKLPIKDMNKNNGIKGARYVTNSYSGGKGTKTDIWEVH